MSGRGHILRSGGVFFALSVTVVIACGDDGVEEDDNQFRADVLWCEEALARLTDCCPGFDARVVECNYYYSFDKGCGSPTTKHVQPALTASESECIRDLSCDQLIATNVCARAQAARAPNLTSKAPSGDASAITNDGTTRGPSVCP